MVVRSHKLVIPSKPHSYPLRIGHPAPKPAQRYPALFEKRQEPLHKAPRARGLRGAAGAAQLSRLPPTESVPTLETARAWQKQPFESCA